MRAFISISILLTFIGPLSAMEAPTLHEISIEGLISSPQLSVDTLSLEMNREYLFVISNSHKAAFNIQFEKFGQSVSTRYLKGSPSVTQESINVLPQGKVLWHFITTKGGEFPFYVVNAGTMQQSEKRKIIVVDPSVVKTVTEEKKVTAEKEMEKPDTLTKAQSRVR